MSFLHFRPKFGFWNRLSDRQSSRFASWRRLAIVSNQPCIINGTVSADKIKQGMVSDCSFVSSLLALAQHEEKFGQAVLSSIIYPQDECGHPLFNPYGKYGCKLHLNGCFRHVSCDDFVPVRTTGNLLCSHSSDPTELWVSLLEKCFAKVAGFSYAISGSNPCIDMHHLSGWKLILQDFF